MVENEYPNMTLLAVDEGSLTMTYFNFLNIFFNDQGNVKYISYNVPK
jgi:hypothetical protein